MSNYELTLVLPEKATTAKKKAAKETVQKFVKTLKGKVEKDDDWGKIDLAQDLNGESAGNFLYFELELEPEAAKQFEQKIKLEEDFLRHLFVKREE